MITLDLDRAFSANYSARHINVPLIHFPGGTRAVARDLLIEISTVAMRFCCVFTAGSSDNYGLHSCPDPDEICLLAGGMLYIVNTSRALDHASILYENIKQVVPVPERRMLLLSCDTGLIAYGRGELWDSGQICLDELRIERVDEANAYVTCWDPHQDSRAAFKVDLSSGVPIGYSMP